MVSGSLRVEAANPGAHSALGVKAGDGLEQVQLPPEMREALMSSVQDVLRGSERREKLLKANLEAKAGAVLFRIMRLADISDHGPAALVVSTNFRWPETTGALLSTVFQLTEAEQSVVRMLAEGQDTKSIAASRETGEGTVRLQIKSIIGKMNLRSQTDIVRLVLTLGEFPKGSPEAANPVELTAPQVTRNWLEAEVWKPFKTLALPDGRTLTYHDMGPSIGSCQTNSNQSQLGQ